MKTLLTVTLFVLLFFAACGNDTIINNSTPVETRELIFGRDSVGLSTNDSGWVYLTQFNVFYMDSLYNLGAEKIEISFNGETNLTDLSNKSLYLRLEENSSGYWVKSLSANEEILGNHSYTINIRPHTMFGYYIHLLFTEKSGYINFKNLKIHKIVS